MIYEEDLLLSQVTRINQKVDKFFQIEISLQENHRVLFGSCKVNQISYLQVMDCDLSSEYLEELNNH